MLRLRWTVWTAFSRYKIGVCVFFGSVSAWREVEYLSRRVGWKWKHEGFLDLIWIYWNFFFNLEGGDQTLQWSFTRSEFGWNWDVFWFGVLPAKSTFWNGICQITFWKRIVWSLKASYISFESYFWGMYFYHFYHWFIKIYPSRKRLIGLVGPKMPWNFQKADSMCPVALKRNPTRQQTIEVGDLYGYIWYKYMYTSYGPTVCIQII